MLIYTIIATLCVSCALSQLPDKKSAFHLNNIYSTDTNNDSEPQLEKVVEPTGYHLELEPYLEDGIFKGHVRINVTWLKDADKISVDCAHEVKITYSNVRALVPKNSKEIRKIPIKQVLIHVSKATIYLVKPVSKHSTGFLEFNFTGNLETNSSEGFFRTTYERPNVNRIFAATQLRPFNASRMFPCFDEPGYKTPFEISVLRPRSMVAISNAPVASTEDIADDPDAVWDHFKRTPPMSTFTLGLVIADLKMLENTTHIRDEIGNDIELRVWVRPALLPALNITNEKLSKVFCSLTRLLQVPLPLKKLDIIGLPNYVRVQPANSFGLIVFEESDLRYKGYMELAQELSYQWLKALTTPINDDPLVEELPRFIASEADFLINDGYERNNSWPVTDALYTNYYKLSKPSFYMESNHNTIELFIRMFNFVLGGDTFKKGVEMLLKTRQFKTYTENDFWNALNTVAIEDNKITKDIDLQVVANTWFDKDRLPAVMAERNYDKNSVSVSQKVFLRVRPYNTPDVENLLWKIPLVLTREDKLNFSKTTPVAWLKDKQLTINDMPGKDEFVIINPEEIGPFPVNYDSHNWYLLSQYLQSEKRTSIPELTRAKLLHDAWSLAYAGELSFDSALNMTLFLKNEREAIVWYPVFTLIDSIGRRISDCLEDKFQTFVRLLLIPLFERLSVELKSVEDINLVTYAQAVLCRLGYRPCVKVAQTHFDYWIDSEYPEDTIPRNCFCAVFRYGTKEEWELGLKKVINFKSSNQEAARRYLLRNLAGCPKDEWRINRILNITVLEGNGNFTENDLFMIFNRLTVSSQGYTTLFHFLNNNWEFLKEKFSSNTKLWENLLDSATNQFKTQEGLDMVSKFYKSHRTELGTSKYIIEQALAKIREEVKWTSQNIPVIEKWLDWYIENSNVKDDVVILNE